MFGQTLAVARHWPRPRGGFSVNTIGAGGIGGGAWIPAHAPDGRPDLQGVWTDATITPFERPRELAEKQVLTEEEAAQLQ